MCSGIDFVIDALCIDDGLIGIVNMVCLADPWGSCGGCLMGDVCMVLL